MEGRSSTVINWEVTVLFVLQIVGWVGLVATFEHSPGPVVGWVQTLPAIVRVLVLPLGVLAIPALAIALAVGWVLSLAGHPPTSMPPLLIARGDLLVFASAYVVAVCGAWVSRHRLS